MYSQFPDENRINTQYYKTGIGELILGSYDDRLCLLDFRYRKMKTVDNRIMKVLNAVFLEHDSEVLEKTGNQLDEYLNGERKEFDIPLLMAGTDFQKSVWEALMKVPYGPDNLDIVTLMPGRLHRSQLKKQVFILFAWSQIPVIQQQRDARSFADHTPELDFWRTGRLHRWPVRYETN
ncbi:MAG: hypothetical protein KAR40_17485 [Candidatus Sabulitectum sp.]|nr:hypothetical protein [Candidatus Sabulitectum sp.]